MRLQTIPTKPIPNQAFSLVLAERNVTITLRTLQGVIYADVLCESVPVCAGRVCQDREVFTTRAEQLGFPGLALCFADLRGNSDPQWAELGTRYLLLSVELDADDLAELTAIGSITEAGLTYDGQALYDGTGTFDGLS